MADHAVARGTLFALRQTIARMEGKALAEAAGSALEPVEDGFSPCERTDENGRSKLLPIGIAAFDDLFQGGLPLKELMEFRGGELRDAGAVTGFALALCALINLRQAGFSADKALFLWIGERMVTMETGMPHPDGLKDYGLPAGHLLYAAPKRIEEALWLAESALASRSFAAVLLEVRGNPARFGLTESRRLSLKARATGRPIFLLRQAGEEEASSAFLRLNVRPAPSALRLLPDGSRLDGSVGNPVFHLTVEKSRFPASADLFLEWTPDDRQFRPATAAQNPALPERQPADPVAAFPASADRQDRARPLGHVVAFGRAS